MGTEQFAGAFASDPDVFAVYDDDSDLRIDPMVIREAGWHRGGECECEREHCDGGDVGWCSCGPPVDVVTEPLERWHNETHDGAYRFCDERPCIDVREALREV